ncbi:chemotaxis protein CheA [Teredinibacter haidensis]|uniref:chemotaxis protein CheA n=1 Tax=Teredinibacter haidensis TaxID=2731755 RepID=UPI000948FF11|nr:chemotaxis protein CheA [Teredinibacter haidensis]
MTIDLSQFHQVFYEESFEGLDVMEAALMELDPDNIDDETINSIFRSAHSIKGGSATFGFTSVSEFTHGLETILDQVRSGKRKFGPEDVNTCLKSVDCMREMLQLLQAGEEGHTNLSVELKNTFEAMLENKPVTQQPITLVSDAENTDETAVFSPRTTELPEGKIRLFRISFIPEVGILKTGNDVVRMFRELSDLGDILENNCTGKFNNFATLDPENCYLSWNLLIETEKERQLIEEVFEWVEDESELSIVEECPQKCWYITFRPAEDILRSGNEPLRLFRALRDLGDLKIKANTENILSLNLMDHELCALYWDIELYAESITQDEILEVFEWVKDDAELDIRFGSHVPKEHQEKPEAPIVGNAEYGEVERPATSSSEIPTSELVEINKESPPLQSATTPVVAKVNAIAAKKTTAENGSIRVGIDKVDNLINMVGELVITQSMLGQLGTDFEVERIPKLLEGLTQLEQNTRELQESVMRIRMLPISFAFSRFPRMVRDLGQSLGKQIHLEMHGEQTELDKTVMEKIGDPLVHLVRNAVDHGIELPDEREGKGKPALGSIALNAYHQGGNVVIEIRDDGKGLDRAAIRIKAIEKSVVTEAEAENFSDEQMFDLIFQPGFSTAKTVSDVSGRGVGMDVVKRNIQALNGTVELKSKIDEGSTITIRLPLTLAILDGQLVRVGNETYIFPLVSIVESLQCRKESISKVAGGCDVFKLRDDYVPIIELYKSFAIRPDTKDLDQSLIVVVESDGEKVGIVVDELLAQQQVVIKSLEQNYRRVDGVSGATILGDGTVALILDVGGIVKLAGEKFGVAHQLTQTRNHAAQLLDSQAIGIC